VHGIIMGSSIACHLAIAELLLDGSYQTIDLSRMSYQRVIDGEQLLEIGFSA